VFVFLINRDDFHIDVLKQFAHMHDFISVDIVEALRFRLNWIKFALHDLIFFRRYLFIFLLPGEAQKIDRIMEAFAQRYYECNPDIYANAGKLDCFDYMELCFFINK